ncbi:unnamed protein product [Microthlaspi erraticum]|uniref:F-box/LRR-repeat protein 15/At3g58940/PEG3-like LRR domain-containing protein n=1 Tax=Microthlaspi erraticum TaxID=1685480 RepID=A0A6D2LM23_9BRAS|nr:unnamed protein product [Microthlaspi erraticum]
MEKQKLNEFPDDLIMKILSFLPMFKKTVATHLISKRWEEPWELVPDVMFEEDVADGAYESFMSFVYGSLLSRDAHILERLHLKLSRIYSASDINFLVQIAVNRGVRKLRIGLYGYTLELPSCLSTCTTLKSLILSEVSIEVVTREFRLPSLKSLHVLSVEFQGDDDSAVSLLQKCPDLEYLAVYKTILISTNVRALSTYRNLKTVIPLKTLIVSEVSINDVPSWFRLPSLKAMHLLSVQFLGKESVAKLLRICPFLEDLIVKRTGVFNSLWPTVSACRTLKTLILREVSIEVVSPWFCLHSLKCLHLLSVEFLDDKHDFYKVARFLNIW